MIDVIEEFNVYTGTDGRVRCYSKLTHKGTSYPRILMEIKLGRKLNENEQVHHIDENPLNNNYNNLKILLLGEHQRIHSTKYHDKEVICPCCGKKFTWTSKSQSHFYRNYNRTIPKTKGVYPNGFCSKSCASYAGRMYQLGILNIQK